MNIGTNENTYLKKKTKQTYHMKFRKETCTLYRFISRFNQKYTHQLFKSSEFVSNLKEV